MSERPLPEPVLQRRDATGSTFARALAETTRSLVCVLDRSGRILLDSLGGSLSIHSPPGEGTTVRALLPPQA